MKLGFGFYFSLFLLFFGIIAGFSLLSFVYTGPVWVKLLVFFIILFITVSLIVALKRFIVAIKESEDDEK